MTPPALPGTLAGSGVFGERKSVRMLSKKKKIIATGVKNSHFGVKDKKTDSKVLSLKNEEISLV